MLLNFEQLLKKIFQQDELVKIEEAKVIWKNKYDLKRLDKLHFFFAKRYSENINDKKRDNALQAVLCVLMSYNN